MVKKITYEHVGNAAGLGFTREMEVNTVLHQLGIESESIHIINSNDFEDSFSAVWNETAGIIKLSNLIKLLSPTDV